MSLINSIFIFKLIHFTIFIFIFYFFFILIKNFLSISHACIGILIFIGLSQTTEYLDPFIAWPEAYAMSILLGFTNAIIFKNIIDKGM